MIRNMLIFFIAFEVANFIFPHVESAWRMKSWTVLQLRKKMAEAHTSTDGEKIQIETVKIEEPTPMPGYGFYRVLSMVYSIFTMMLFFTFNPICMIGAIAINVWGFFVATKKPTKLVTSMDGGVSAAILLAVTYFM